LHYGKTVIEYGGAKAWLTEITKDRAQL
jgi:hypothetical protein